jgi:hypothetical protein
MPKEKITWQACDVDQQKKTPAMSAHQTDHFILKNWLFRINSVMRDYSRILNFEKGRCTLTPGHG